MAARATIPAVATDPNIVVYRISGAFFFGAAASVAAALERIGEHPKAYIIDFTGVSVFDSTAAATIEGFARKVARRGGALYISGATASIRHVLLAQGVRPPRSATNRSWRTPSRPRTRRWRSRLRRNRRYRYLSSTSTVLSQPMRWKLSLSQRSAVS